MPWAPGGARQAPAPCVRSSCHRVRRSDPRPWLGPGQSQVRVYQGWDGGIVGRLGLGLGVSGRAYVSVSHQPSCCLPVRNETLDVHGFGDMRLCESTRPAMVSGVSGLRFKLSGEFRVRRGPGRSTVGRFGPRQTRTPRLARVCDYLWCTGCTGEHISVNGPCVSALSVTTLTSPRRNQNEQAAEHKYFGLRGRAYTDFDRGRGHSQRTVDVPQHG